MKVQGKVAIYISFSADDLRTAAEQFAVGYSTGRYLEQTGLVAHAAVE